MSRPVLQANALMAAAMVAVLAACAPLSAAPAGPPVAAVGQVTAYDCGYGAGAPPVAADVRDGELWLFLPDQTVRLPRVGAGRYAEGATAFEVRGTEATLATTGGSRRCVKDVAATPWEAAKLAGVSFRAVGQEPGWVLEIVEGERLSFRPQTGPALQTPAPAPRAEAGRTVFAGEAGGRTLVVTLSPAPCRDSMSGENFPTTVTVEADGRRYSGCGRALH